MATSGDTDRRDDELLSLLYGELEGDDETAARSRVAADDELGATLAGYESVRALYAELPEDEPPAAMSQQLLAAAAQRKPARKGFLAGLLAFLEPIALHPGLAAAASLALIAGVAGVLFATGRADMAQPSAKSAARAPEAAAVPAVPEPSAAETAPGGEAAVEETAAEKASADEAAPADFGAATGLVGGAEGGAAERPAQENDRERAGKGKPGPRRKRRAPLREPVVGGAAPAKTAPTTRSRAKVEETAGPAPRADTARGRGDSEGWQANAPEKKAPPPRPAQQGRRGTAGGDAPAQQQPASPGTASDEAPAQAPADDDGTAARALHERALRAASSNECGAVASLGDRIRKLDRRYHDEVFVRDDRLAACLRGR